MPHKHQSDSGAWNTIALVLALIGIAILASVMATTPGSGADSRVEKIMERVEVLEAKYAEIEKLCKEAKGRVVNLEIASEDMIPVTVVYDEMGIPRPDPPFSPGSE